MLVSFVLTLSLYLTRGLLVWDILSKSITALKQLAGPDANKISVLSGLWPRNELCEQGAPLKSDIRVTQGHSNIELQFYTSVSWETIAHPLSVRNQKQHQACQMSHQPGHSHCPSTVALKFGNSSQTLRKRTRLANSVIQHISGGAQNLYFSR